jgi:hypothetical protein
MDRDLRRQQVGLVVQGAGVALSPEAGWLLLRLNDSPGARLEELQPTSPFDVDELRRGANDLVARDLVVRDSAGRWELTKPGCASLARVVQARQRHLEALFAQWEPKQQSALADLLRRLGPQVVQPARQVA